jgi:catalase-peroxidase
MLQSMPLSQLVLLAISALPLTSAVSCPYIGSNGARGNAPRIPHPESILEPRYSPEGADFGRCSRKSKVAGGGTRSGDWWPCDLNLAVLRQNGDKSNPWDAKFDYATEFAKLDGKLSTPCGAHRNLFTLGSTDTNDWWFF